MKNRNTIKYLYNVNPFYVHWKKHFCPKCGIKMKTDYDSIVVNSDSPKANDYDFSVVAGDSYLTGNVEFRKSFLDVQIANLQFLLMK